jgi:MFS family permease
MRLLLKHPNLLSFSILQIIFSAPGQTFLIALIVIPIFSELDISMTQFAGLYSAATLMASLCLNPAGRFVDQWSVNRIVFINSFLMALGCVLLATSTTITQLFIAFFFLRFIGQGVFGLTSSIILINAFEKNRGQAVGLMTLGFPLSEIIYPTLTLFLLGSMGWRNTYLIFALSYLVIMLPLQFILIKRSKLKKGAYFPDEMLGQPETLLGVDKKTTLTSVSLTVPQVIKSSTFYLVTIANCVPALVMTGLFFHQEIMFKTNGWEISNVAIGIVIYALCKAISSVSMGSIIDKYGPLWPFVITILLLSTGTLITAYGGPNIMIFIYFGIMGMALGISSPVMNVVYPNLYGVKHIGAIKGLMATFRNGLTAFAPLLIAIVLDMGKSLPELLFYTGIGISLLATLPIIAYWIDPRLNGRRS